MRLQIKNIGKVADADIIIDGITIIAGENNTGKSTIGEVLFCIFNSFHNPEERIKSERVASITRALMRLADAAYNTPSGESLFFLVSRDSFAKRILSSWERDSSLRGIEECIKNSILEMQPDAADFISDNGEEVSEVAQRIGDVLTVSDDDLLRAVLTRSFRNEFSSQINNIYTEEPASVELVIKNMASRLTVEDNSVSGIDGVLHLRTEAVYLDDPFVLDAMRYAGYFRLGVGSDHRDHLRSRLELSASQERGREIDQIIDSSRLKEVLAVINRVCEGEIVDVEDRGFGLKLPGVSKLLDLSNLSSGLKTFAIFKQLLLNGTIEERGTLILDEPEIHLHPEWQIVFAQLVVLLQKEFSLHVLLNTHSPYFLSAVQVYANQYGVADVCRFYQATLSGTVSHIKEVSDNVESLYAQLVSPFQQLEDQAYGV